MRKPIIVCVICGILGVLTGLELPRFVGRFGVRWPGIVSEVHQVENRSPIRTNELYGTGTPSTAGIQPCFTTVQTYVTVDQIAYLTADVPAQGAADLGAVFQVKGPTGNEPWQTCTAAGKCNGAALPDISHPGADPADGSPRYAAMVSAVTAQSGILDFASPRWIRLVTRYNMSPVGPCVSQETFEVNPGDGYPIYMFIPANKTIRRLTTFWRELLPGKAWTQCDDVVDPVTNTVWVGGGNCGGVRFGYEPPLVKDPSDHSSGLYIGCTTKSVSGSITIATHDRRGCRIQLQYN